MNNNSRPQYVDSPIDPSQHKKSYRKHILGGSIMTSCVICGSSHIETGKIFHGHCVCEDCVEYIVSSDEISETSAG